MKTKTFLLSKAGRYLMLLTILTIGVNQVKAEDVEIAKFESSAVIGTGSTYTVYQNDDWYLSRGGGGSANHTCGWNKANGTQDITLDETFGVSGVTTSTYGFYIYSKSALANVEKITITNSNTSNSMSSTDALYLLYSTDDGSSWTQISLNSGSGLSAQGESAGISAMDKTYTFTKIASARYAILFNGGSTTSSPFRFDNVVITFSRELVTRPVAWKVENVAYTTGGGSTSVAVGEKVEALPTPPSVPAACTAANAGAKFMGWTAIANYSGAGAPSDLFTTPSGAPAAPAGTGTITYHAVFADPAEVAP